METESAAKKRKRVGDAWGWRCVYCGSAVQFGLWDSTRHRAIGDPSARAAIDHVMPVSRGGEDSPANQVLACFRCNSSKRDLMLMEWLESANCTVPRWRSFAFLLDALPAAA